MLHALFLAFTQQDWQVETTIKTSDPFDSYATAMAVVRDIDRDGIDEVLVGAFSSSAAFQYGGAAHLYSGATGHVMFSFYAEQESSQFGLSVADAGDADADGFTDVIVGAPSYQAINGELGAAYLYSGRSGQLLYRILGTSTQISSMGEAVAGLDDVNADGFADFAIGERHAAVTPGSEGAVWVHSGRDGSLLYDIHAVGTFGVGARLRAISDLDQDGIRDLLVTISGGVALHSGRTGAEIRRHPHFMGYDNFGHSLAAIGDADFDGYEDYAIGASDSGTDRPGRVYVHSGQDGSLLALIIGDQREGEFGSSLAGCGDVDGDGHPDLLVGAQSENKTVRYRHGAAHLISGFDWSVMTSFLSLEPEVNWVGNSVAAAGDLDGDGFGDLWIGSYSDTGVLTVRGVVRSYVQQPILRLTSRSISASAGGALGFDLNFPPSEAGKRYAILMSSGAGRTRAGGAWLPLDRTPLLARSITHPPAGFRGQSGWLNSYGDAHAGFVLAPNQAAPWVGRTLKFCAVSWDAAGGVGRYSAAIPWTILP